MGKRHRGRKRIQMIDDIMEHESYEKTSRRKKTMDVGNIKYIVRDTNLLHRLSLKKEEEGILFQGQFNKQRNGCSTHNSQRNCTSLSLVFCATERSHRRRVQVREQVEYWDIFGVKV